MKNLIKTILREEIRTLKEKKSNPCWDGYEMIGMKEKDGNPERRKSFRARHNCDNPGPKWKARYWSCKAW